MKKFNIILFLSIIVPIFGGGSDTEQDGSSSSESTIDLRRTQEIALPSRTGGKSLIAETESLIDSQLRSMIIPQSDVTALLRLLQDHQEYFDQLPFEKKKSYYVDAQERENIVVQGEKSSQTHVKAHLITSALEALCALQSIYVFPQYYFSNPGAPLMHPTPRQVFRHLIRTEQIGIHGCMYHFSLFDVANDMITQRTEEGKKIPVALVVDHRFRECNCQALNWLVSHGADVRTPRPINKYEEFRQMHHKFLIFYKTLLGNPVLVTGSFNLTGFSDTNSWEDIAVIDDLKMILQYQAGFKRLFDSSQPITVQECRTKKPKVSDISLRNDRVPPGAYDQVGRFVPTS